METPANDAIDPQEIEHVAVDTEAGAREGSAPTEKAPTEGALEENTTEAETGIVYRVSASEEIVDLLDPVENQVGLNLEQLAIEDKQRLQYNQLSREIRKRKAREINFDHCAGWASNILERQSKDLQVAIWYATAVLWSESANETEKLVGFRDALVLIKELISIYGDTLYPLGADGKAAVLSEFGNSNRLSKISRIETLQKKERFRVSEETIQGLLDEQAPVSLRNDLRELLNREYEKVSFIKYVQETAFERFEPSQEQMEKLKKKGKVLEATKQAATEYYLSRICELAALPVEYPAIQFAISKYTLHHLQRYEFPEFVLSDLAQNEGLSAVGEDHFGARLQQRITSNWRSAMDEKELEDLCQLIIDYCNQNRWLWLEIEFATSALLSVVDAHYSDHNVSLKVLKEVVANKAEEMRALVEAGEAEEMNRQAGLRGQIKILQDEIGLLKDTIGVLQKENSALQEENALLKSALEVQTQIVSDVPQESASEDELEQPVAPATETSS